jgi:hypothetical protein
MKRPPIRVTERKRKMTRRDLQVKLDRLAQVSLRDPRLEKAREARSLYRDILTAWDDYEAREKRLSLMCGKISDMEEEMHSVIEGQDEEAAEEKAVEPTKDLDPPF